MREDVVHYFQLFKKDSLCILYCFPAQTLLSENNGVVDGPATDVQEHQLMSSAYQLLLQVLNTAFSW